MTTATNTPTRRRPGRPRRSQPRTTLEPREEILRQASVLFSAQGVGATSLSDIARAVNVTPAAIYYHFAGRDDIVAALLDYVIEETDAFSCDADASAPPAARLHQLLARHVTHLTSSPYDLWFVIGVSDAEARNHPALVAHVRAWRAALEAVLHDGVEASAFLAIEPNLAVATLSGLVSAALQLHHETGSVDAQTIAQLAVRSVAIDPGDWTEPRPKRQRPTKEHTNDR